ncbi:DUF6585 family protein [Ktedonobacter robiniae]|uniref:DUF304 domain-containing protein n=1 Tax=Ktedonobacter robiniae TaxID=2778365 RepID=A0ABQ3UXG8_9CHLR|nr:DUF6585 family protein [Ktedonobacter robiniae]GHO57375.1 hypothetical protein KSB_58500 [Ktedonobacter robiniae]
MQASSSITNDSLLLGSQYELGNLRATYKPSTSCLIIMLAILVTMGVLATFFGIAFVFMANSLFPLIATVVGLLFIIFPGVGIVQAYRNRVLRVFVYDAGLLYLGRLSTQAVRWQSIQAVWHNVIVKTHTSTDGEGHTSTTTTYNHVYVLALTDGSTLKLDETFAKLRELGKTIEVETARLIFPTALSTYQTYQTVQFGPVSLTPQAFYLRNDMLSWSELKSINIDESHGNIVIKKHGKLFRWASVSLGDVPNIEVFRMLVQHITGIRP